MFWVIGRLRPGATIVEARAQLGAVATRIAEVDPRWHKGQGIGVVSLHEDVVGTVKPVLHVLLGAVALVLVIATTNVANVLLARGAERQREIVLRAALGATRGRLLRELLAESVVLSLLGGALGLLWASWGVSALLAGIPDSVRAPMAYLDQVHIDGRVLLFALAVSLLVGLLAGIVPALRATRGNGRVYEHLKEGAPTLARGRHRFQDALVAGEVAIALVLVLGAGLLTRSLVRLIATDPGFDTRNLLTFQIAVPPELSPVDRAMPLRRALLERLRALPGVRGAALVDTLPLTGGGGTGTPTVVGRPAATSADELEAHLREVSAAYFEVMRVPILEGRAITEDDVARQAPVMVINRALQQRLFPGERALGRQVMFAFTGETRWEIVGVAGDERVTTLDVEPPPALYTPDSGGMRTAVVVRAAGDPHALAAAAARAAREVSRDLAVFEAATMDEIIASSPRTFLRRYPAILLGSFGATALLLALVGIYGVLAQDTVRRTREIGVRMALGAQRADVLALVLGRVLALTGAGVALGATGSLVAGRALSALLFGVAPGDVRTLVAGAAIMVAAALVAAWLPARRALSIDPVLALRHD